MVAYSHTPIGEAERRDWQGVLWVEDAGVSAKSLKRKGLQSALAQLARGESDVLIVAKLDRVSRSVAHFATLLRRADREGWSLRVL